MQLGLDFALRHQGEILMLPFELLGQIQSCVPRLDDDIFIRALLKPADIGCDNRAIGVFKNQRFRAFNSRTRVEESAIGF